MNGISQHFPCKQYTVQFGYNIYGNNVIALIPEAKTSPNILNLKHFFPYITYTGYKVKFFRLQA